MFGGEKKAEPTSLRKKEVTPPLLSRSLQFCGGNDTREAFCMTGYSRICVKGNHSGRSEKRKKVTSKEPIKAAIDW